MQIRNDTVLYRLLTAIQDSLYRESVCFALDSLGDESGQPVESVQPIARVLIADDNALVRSSLRALIQAREGWTVVGEAVDGMDVIEKAVHLHPNVILVDVSMPGLNGLAVAAGIQKRVQDAKVLIVADHDPCVLSVMSSQPGVGGFVAKSRLGLDLIPAVEAAIKQQSVASSASA